MVWGVRDVARAIEFWCAALNYKPLREPSEDWAILVPVTGEGQQMAITIVSSDPSTHQRHHLDLYASDQQAEVERLLSLGAQRVDWRYPEGADYIVLADPDGNTFCVVQKEMEQTGVANPST
ncbi:VOC family protein [Rhizobium sp. PEPV16]|nr:VOC family protein [Rhizobium sp. PEPV16]